MTSQRPNPAAPIALILIGAVVLIALVGSVIADPALARLLGVVTAALLGAAIAMYLFRDRIFRR